MIKQCAVTDIQSRSECVPYDATCFLPLITSNMYSVVDKHNASIYLNSKIKVCMPRKEYMDESYQYCSDENYFDSFSLDDFIQDFITTDDGFLHNSTGDKVKTSVCIDTAAGHLKKLHNAIREAKKIHGDSLVIMAGNVSSVEAFVELAKTGVDYIRVGIGGGSGCNTTNNTGVGQEDLGELIYWCRKIQKMNIQAFAKTNSPNQIQKAEHIHLCKVRIVADGISSYIKLCQQKYNFNDNGYAAIIKLLNSGADLVMVGGLFAQCVESAGEKGCFYDNSFDCPINNISAARLIKERYINAEDRVGSVKVKISGMSTVEEQRKYKEPGSYENWLKVINNDIADNFKEDYAKYSDGDQTEEDYYNANYKYWDSKCVKSSEGSIKWVPVRWTLNEWLNGSSNQDEYPYLNGFINSLKSAMSYTGSKTLNKFKQ